MRLDEMSFKINDPDALSVSSHHPEGAHVLFADGTVVFLENDMEPDDVRRILERGPGE